MSGYADQTQGQETITIHLIKFRDNFEAYRKGCAGIGAIEPYTGLGASESQAEPAAQFCSQEELAAVSHLYKHDQAAAAARETIVKLGPRLADDLKRAGRWHLADLIGQVAMYLTPPIDRKAAFKLWPDLQDAIHKATTETGAPAAPTARAHPDGLKPAMTDRSYSMVKSLETVVTLFKQIKQVINGLSEATRPEPVIEGETESFTWVTDGLKWPEGAQSAVGRAGRDFRQWAAALEREWGPLGPAMRAVIGRLERDGRWEAAKVQEMYDAMEGTISGTPGLASTLSDMAQGRIAAEARAPDSLSHRLSQFLDHPQTFLLAWGAWRGDESVCGKLRRMELAAATDAEANAAALADAAASASAAAAGADTSMRNAPALKQPSTEALKAYRAVVISGRKQVEIAKLLGTNQGQISRWISEANAWIAAGNVLPDIEGMTHKPAAVDPAVINLGERQDHRTKRQRPTADNGD